MAEHPITGPVPGPSPALGEEHAPTITIDCATCVMRWSSACADCVVTFLCERQPTEAVLLDLAEAQALRRLADAGLAPGLRHSAHGAPSAPGASTSVGQGAPRAAR
jgi:hypothetical protein